MENDGWYSPGGAYEGLRRPVSQPPKPSSIPVHRSRVTASPAPSQTYSTPNRHRGPNPITTPSRAMFIDTSTPVSELQARWSGCLKTALTFLWEVHSEVSARATAAIEREVVSGTSGVNESVLVGAQQLIRDADSVLLDMMQVLLDRAMSGSESVAPAAIPPGFKRDALTTLAHVDVLEDSVDLASYCVDMRNTWVELVLGLLRQLWKRYAVEWQQEREGVEPEKEGSEGARLDEHRERMRAFVADVAATIRVAEGLLPASFTPDEGLDSSVASSAYGSAYANTKLHTHAPYSPTSTSPDVDGHRSQSESGESIATTTVSQTYNNNSSNNHHHNNGNNNNTSYANNNDEQIESEMWETVSAKARRSSSRRSSLASNHSFTSNHSPAREAAAATSAVSPGMLRGSTHTRSYVGGGVSGGGGGGGGDGVTITPENVTQRLVEEQSRRNELLNEIDASLSVFDGHEAELRKQMRGAQSHALSMAELLIKAQQEAGKQAHRVRELEGEMRQLSSEHTAMADKIRELTAALQASQADAMGTRTAVAGLQAENRQLQRANAELSAQLERERTMRGL